MSKLNLYQIELGSMANFIYILSDPETKKASVIDPAWDTGVIIRYLEENDLTLESILLTHGHFDHVEGIEAMLEHFGKVPIYISKHEITPLRPPHDLTSVDDKQSIPIGSKEVNVIHTPGHSPGSQCFHFDERLIAGDTLFIDACGRCDLGGSNPEHMFLSLQKLKELPDKTIIYPGHNYHEKSADTLGAQKQTNPYLQGNEEQTFLRKRLGF